MKVMSRNFSTKEKVLMVLMAVLLIGLVYYKFVYTRINQAADKARAEVESLQNDLDVAQIRVARIKKMENEMDGYQKTGLVSKMGSYNNSKMETAFLNTVLAGASDYSISFDEVTRDGDLIRRNFSLQYKTPTYDEAEKIMQELTTGEYRCLIGDVGCTVDNTGQTTVTLIGTFYETMVGGKADSALPADEAETNNAVELSDFE